MKGLLIVFFVSILSFGAFAQSRYAVELASFATAVPAPYFSKVEGVYETIDANYIYRYYKNADSKEAAQKIQKEVKLAGFAHARIIDFEELRAQCSQTCGYTPPRRTKIIEQPIAKIEHLYPIFFDFDKYYLTKESKKELDKYISYMKENPSHSLQLYAHTDSKGNPVYNKTLSQNRAKSATKYLTDRGIAISRLSSTTMGEGDPAAKNEDASGGDLELGRKLNRRIEFKILDSSSNALNITDHIKVPDYLKK